MRASRIRAIAIVAAAIAFATLGRPLWNPLYVKLSGGRTVAQAVQEYGAAARARMAPAFAAAHVAYPPAKLALLGLKAERSLEVWASDGSAWHLVKSYPVLAASGVAGPKLCEGDHQVPEGIYRIIGLNPNSNFHLSMQLDYPNQFDREHAREDGRSNLGGDIFIHGSFVSVGCLAVGDEAIEDLFVLVADAGADNVTVVLAPKDPRTGSLPREAAGAPAWLAQLYDRIDKAFKLFERAAT